MFDLSKTTLNGQHQAIVTTAAALAAGISIYYVVSSSKKNNQPVYKEIPTPGSKLPYFGHLFSLGELPGRTLTKWNQEYGSLIRVKLGKQNWVVIDDPYLAHEIFVTNGVASSDRPKHTYFDYYSHHGKGIVCANADKRWKQARIVALKVLAPQRVDELTGLLVKEADNLVDQLISETTHKGQIDPLSYLQSSAMNVILTTNFGKRISSVEDPLFKEIMHFVELTMKYGEAEGDMSQFIPVLGYLDILVGKKRAYEDFISNVRDPLFRRLIKEACASDTDCLIKSFVALQGEYGLDDKDILVIMSDLLGAGADTISVSLSWLFVILSHHPQTQKRLQAEVDAFVTSHGRLPTFEERDQFPLLISVQRESFRYRPTGAFGIPHVSSEDIAVRDYLIPKGTLLVPNMIGMHMNPSVYPNPETFDPDRFLHNTKTMSASANGSIGNRDMYMFGWGRRICPGIHLAEVEMFLVCTRIFARASVGAPLDKNGNETPIDLYAAKNAGIVLQPQPHSIRFIPRPDSLLNSPPTIV